MQCDGATLDDSWCPPEEQLEDGELRSSERGERPATRTSRVEGSKTMSPTLNLGVWAEAGRRCSARIRARSSPKSNGFVR